MYILYKNIDKTVLYYYCLYTKEIKSGVKKGFGFLSVLCLVFLFTDTSYCEYSGEQEQSNQSSDNGLNSEKQRKYTFSELSGQQTNNVPTDREKLVEDQTLTVNQKKLIIAALFFTICVVSLFVIINSDNHDLQKEIQELQKKVNISHKKNKGNTVFVTSSKGFCS